MRSTPSICLLAALLWTSVAAAQSSTPEAPRPAPAPCLPAVAAAMPPGAYLHDGFYLRLGMGVAYTGFWGSHPAGAGSLRGFGSDTTGAIGGTLGRGVVLGAMLHVTDRESTDGVHSPLGAGTESDSILGLAFLVDWYPYPRKGWHAGGAIGIGGVGISGTNATFFSDSVTGSLLGGYDWWIGPEWSLGLLLVATGVSKATLQDSNGDDSGYHLAGGSIALETSLLLH